MIYIRDEGEFVRNGINVYPWKGASIGAVFKLSNFVFAIRYSRVTNKLYCWLG